MGNGKMTLPSPLPSPSFGWLIPLVKRLIPLVQRDEPAKRKERGGGGAMSSCQCHEYFPQFSAGVKIKDGGFDLQRQGIWRKISNKELLVQLAR